MSEEKKQVFSVKGIVFIGVFAAVTAGQMEGNSIYLRVYSVGNNRSSGIYRVKCGNRRNHGTNRRVYLGILIPWLCMWNG